MNGRNSRETPGIGRRRGPGAVAIAMSLLPSLAHAGDPPRADDQHFTVDPVADGALIAGAGGFSALLELILSTGEITPQRPGSPDKLLSIDRIAVTQTIDSHADTFSSVGLGVAIAFAAADPLLSGARDGWDAAFVDAILYAETISMTLAITDITKVAVRRPRPIAYAEQAALDTKYGGAANSPSITDTDSTLSFFSGHAAVSGAITATATYLAFQRSPHSWRPWVTLAVGTLLTSFVGIERVRAGAHFPTDVIAGALGGGVIGVLVPHLHRHEAEGPHVVVGFAPAPGGGALVLQGIF
jgi:membrane-associated phospholipid phosphatase